MKRCFSNSLDVEEKYNTILPVANKYFEGQLEFQTYDYDFMEIQSESIEEIAIAKVLEAYEMTKEPTIALAAGFYVEKLNGFPGVYVQHFLSTIGIEGLLKLMLGEDERRCYFKQFLVYYDGEGQPKLFYGEQKGVVSQATKGILSKHDWSELSYVFIPNGKEKVLAEMTDEERSILAKENEEKSAFMHFREWYIDDTLSEILKDIVRYIRKRYGQIIVEAYNHYTGGKFRDIEIRYE